MFDHVFLFHAFFFHVVYFLLCVLFREFMYEIFHTPLYMLLNLHCMSLEV
jgi:hypothetical protein